MPTYYMECYKFEKLEYKSGFLDDCVDATYIIHLEGNGRLPHIHEQLRKFQPSRTVYISVNSGFKKCEKEFARGHTTPRSNSCVP